MLLVANQRQRVAQLVGLFTFEGGVTLVQLLSPHAVPFPVQLGVTVIDVLFVLTLGHYLARFPEIVPPDEPADSPAEREGV
jgi:hydrogenase-4 membrane subunit HyfE